MSITSRDQIRLWIKERVIAIPAVVGNAMSVYTTPRDEDLEMPQDATGVDIMLTYRGVRTAGTDGQFCKVKVSLDQLDVPGGSTYTEIASANLLDDKDAPGSTRSAPLTVPASAGDVTGLPLRLRFTKDTVATTNDVPGVYTFTAFARATRQSGC